MKKYTQQLVQARAYERSQAGELTSEERPSFHFASPIGWINDPNGFSVFQGEYHLFYQYHPYSTIWGPMHWGHAKSSDFIKWNYLPAALAPDQVYDQEGCFSGSGIEDNGEHILVYTGVIEESQEDGTKVKRQVQNLAFGDGREYKKYRHNPIVDGAMLPTEFHQEDFRDPKIWKEGDTYFMVVGNCTQERDGHVVLFTSETLTEWNYKGVIDRSNGEYGLMWECPDFFELDGCWLLLASPQDMRAKGLEFHNGNGVIYSLGTFDKAACHFTRQYIGAVDYGLDFYAPQTLLAEDGRRIMIAWMQSWDSNITPGTFKWSGMMSVPRELTLRSGRLVQAPVRELDQYLKNKVVHKQVSLDRITMLDGVKGRTIDLRIEITEGDYKKFQIHFAHNEDYTTFCAYDPEKGILHFDRNYCGLSRDVVCTRDMYVRKQDQRIKLRLLIDKYSVELFVNDGEQVMTSAFYTPLNADEVVFDVEGTLSMDVIKYDVVTEGGGAGFL